MNKITGVTQIKFINYLIKSCQPIVIISGEGENGTEEIYNGTLTAKAILSRLSRERRHGQRWAKVDFADVNLRGQQS